MPEQPLAAAPVPVAAAAPTVPSAPTPAAEPAFRPRTWWQWILLYPAVGLALVSAVPGWVDSFGGILQGVMNAKYSELQERHALFVRNGECLSAPIQWYREPRAGRVIDATLCPTGDIFVRVLVPDDGSQLATVIDGQRFRERSDFVSLDKFVSEADRFAAADLFGMTAHAATLPQSTPQISLSAQGDLVPVQDQFALVVCQKFVDARHLLRHLQVQGQCFDETVDTYTGTTVSRMAVPCRQSC
jgi:hypothetical protein